MKEQTQNIYNQEYEEVVARIKNTLDLSNKSPSYLMVPTSLCNLEIVLPLRLFWEQWDLPEPPPSHMPEPWEFNIDGTRALLDLSWSQQAPQVQPDDIDKDPRYSSIRTRKPTSMKKMKRTWRWMNGHQVKLVAPIWLPQLASSAPTTTQKLLTLTPWQTRLWVYPVVSTLIRMWPWRWEVWVWALADQKPQGYALGRTPKKQTRMLSAPDLVSSITKGMTMAVTEILERFAHPPLVDDMADATIWEHFQQWRATASQSTPAGTEAPGWISAFDRLGHRAQTPQKEDHWVPKPEMTPQKVERGCQASCMAGQEPPCSTSHKRCSQSRPRNEVDSKKGHMDGNGRSSKVQVGIDWSNTGIQKPVPKPDPCHPSFKPDPSGSSSDQQPRVKSSVVSKGSQKQSSSHSTPPRSQEPSERQSRKASSKTSGLTDPEKLELKEKQYRWIVARIHCLDPKGYVEEIHSFWHFHRNSKSFALKIITIADWGYKCADVRFHYPIPAFPHYLFNEFARSRQGGG